MRHVLMILCSFVALSSQTLLRGRQKERARADLRGCADAVAALTRLRDARLGELSASAGTVLLLLEEGGERPAAVAAPGQGSRGLRGGAASPVAAEAAAAGSGEAAEQGRSSGDGGGSEGRGRSSPVDGLVTGDNRRRGKRRWAVEGDPSPSNAAGASGSGGKDGR